METSECVKMQPSKQDVLESCWALPAVSRTWSGPTQKVSFTYLSFFIEANPGGDSKTDQQRESGSEHDRLREVDADQ